MGKSLLALFILVVSGTAWGNHAAEICHSYAVDMTDAENAATLCRSTRSNAVTSALRCFSDFGDEDIADRSLALACQGAVSNSITAIWMCLDDARDLALESDAAILCNGVTQRNYVERMNCFRRGLERSNAVVAATLCGGIRL